MAREQGQNTREAQHTREKKHGSNPGTFSPDDDEAQEADITRAGEQPMQGDEQAQGRRGRRAQNVEQVDDDDDAVEADDIDDDDESDSPQIP